MDFKCTNTKTYDQLIALYNNSSKGDATEKIIWYVLDTSACILLFKVEMFKLATMHRNILDWIEIKVESMNF